MCNRFESCSNDGTYQLVLENRNTGMEVVEYYCKAHLVLRVWEVERDDVLDVRDARALCATSEADDAASPVEPSVDSTGTSE
ncbi:hypothetical protein [Natrialba swarupiae]|uniref:Uncharacterized protein n=1 Tax=Natrialba swarupiae TaxID=2448032 RepID=A0A5D5ARI3_9EURY|nr:hypothetical protein [Natrialba swarupiae]TYT63643.1 hypothetical protein FYC77_03420 [Natrialba swarupiae]